MQRKSTHPDVEPESASFELDGLRITVAERELWAMNPEWEVVTRGTLLAELRPGDVFVDVGAHVGVITCPAAAQVGPTGCVHAIEPSPATQRTLAANVAANQLTNVSIHRCAAGATRGVERLHLMSLSYLNGLSRHPAGQESGCVEIEVWPLDDLLSGRVDLVKVDVEGGELAVLGGMRRIVDDNPDIVLCVEWNPETLSGAGKDPLALIDVLTDLGLVPQYVIDESDRGRILRVEDVWASLVSGHDAMVWGNVIAHRLGRRPVRQFGQ